MVEWTSLPFIQIEPGLAGLTEEQLQVARSEAAKQRISLRESILRLGVVTEGQLLTAAAERMGVPFTSISAEDIQPEAITAITANVASHYCIAPLSITDETLLIATCDPFNSELRSEIRLVLDNSHELQFALATSEAIQKAIRKSYGVGAATVEQLGHGRVIGGYRRDLGAGLLARPQLGDGDLVGIHLWRLTKSSEAYASDRVRCVRDGRWLLRTMPAGGNCTSCSRRWCSCREGLTQPNSLRLAPANRSRRAHDAIRLA